jgi:pyruvate dehydrogenase E2 component (dihydrolipoamide acetyltransferase)
MANAVVMPQAGQSMTEGKIIQWFFKEGDKVRRGDPIFEIETDKANMDVESPADGVLHKILQEAGATVDVLKVVAVIAGDGESVDVDAVVKDAEAQSGAADSGSNGKAPAAEAPGKAAAPAKKKAPAKTKSKKSAAARPAASVQAVAMAPPPPTSSGRLRASPLARKLAAQRGLRLEALSGSGPNGRIIRRDVESAPEAPAVGSMPAGLPFAPAAPSTVSSYPDPSPLPPESVALEGMRKAIASGLQASKTQAPHFYLGMEVDVTNTMVSRETLKQRGMKVSVNDFVIYACALALSDEPRVNCRVFNDRVDYPRDVNIGVAVGLEDGLVVPVILQANEKNLRGIAEEGRRIIESARDGKLVGSGKGTFTISNLGMFGVDSFTAIINPPEGAILAVGAAVPRLVPMGGGFFQRTIMRLTLSSDHRSIDGMLAARFLGRVKYLLEHPERLT